MKSLVLQQIRTFSSKLFGRVQRLCARSNLVWTVCEKENKKIINCFRLVKTGPEWDYQLIPELDLLDYEFSEEINILTCPIGYLNETEVINKPWRDKVLEYNSPRLLFVEIKKKFKELKEGQQIVIETTSVTVPEVILTSITPFEGKAQNRLWKLTPTKLKGYRINERHNERA